MPRLNDDAAPARQAAAAILASYEFAALRTVADIGGEGALLAALLRAHPHLRALVFDLDSALGGAHRRGDGAGPGTHASVGFVAGIPAGYDLYLLKNVIRDWDDRAAAGILRDCRAAMAGPSRLLVIDSVSPPRDGSDTHAARFAPTRGADDYRRLFEMAGLDLTRIVPTASALSLIEAVPRAV